MNFEYYYGTQADQFSFIRIPRILLLDEAFSTLSLSAKVLYSVLLDRMGLSMKNKWLDEENKVYIIYQITEIQSDLGFSKKKAMDYLTELEKIGLIEKKKRGFGLPNIIYVKSFMAHQSSQRSNEMGTSQEKDAVHRSIERGTPEVMNKHLRGAETDTSEVPNNGLQEVPKTVPLYNKTYMNYNNQSNMKSNHIKSDGDRIRCDQKEQTINAYAELVKKNIDFDVLLHTYSREQDLVEEIYQLILETVQTEKDMIRIAGEYYPAGFVKGKLLKLNYSHKEFILSVKHTAVSSLPLGSDPLGNIARINNLLESYPKKLADAEQKLETVKEQLENAKQEVVKPFPKEKELNQMMERLSELNALLNMDEQGSSEEPENSGKQSIHDKLNAIKQKGQQEHDHDKPAKGNDIDRS